MDKKPHNPRLARLSVIVMPTGDIICKGKTIGSFKDFKDRLSTDITVRELVDKLERL